VYPDLIVSSTRAKPPPGLFLIETRNLRPRASWRTRKRDLESSCQPPIQPQSNYSISPTTKKRTHSTPLITSSAHDPSFLSQLFNPFFRNPCSIVTSSTHLGTIACKRYAPAFPWTPLQDLTTYSYLYTDPQFRRKLQRKRRTQSQQKWHTKPNVPTPAPNPT